MLREVLKKIALPCRDNGYEFIDHRRLNAIAGCLGEKWKMFWDELLPISHDLDLAVNSRL